MGYGVNPDWTAEAAWNATRRPVDAASALPAACYGDQHFFDIEQERIFGTSWACVGVVDDLDVDGEGRPLLVREVGGRSVIITRNDNGELRAFLNACRHRGTQLAACDGTIGGVIRCPYHRWGYSIDGRLIATPRFDEAPVSEFDRDDYPLHRVRVEAWSGLLFVCLSEQTVPLRTWLGDLPQRLAGYGLDTWSVWDQATFPIAANWKLISENFQEYYHLPWIHPELSTVSRVGDHYRYQGPGMYCGQCTTPVSSGERDDWMSLPPATDLDAGDAASGRFLALFPNVLLSVLPNHAYVMILEPDGPGNTVERGIWLLPPTSHPSNAQLAATKAFWLDINNEDIDIVQRGQKGMSRAYATPGRLSPRFEEPLHRFHNMLADRMTGLERIPGGDPDEALDLYGSGINPLPWLPSNSTPPIH